LQPSAGFGAFLRPMSVAARVIVDAEIAIRPANDQETVLSVHVSLHDFAWSKNITFFENDNSVIFS
jgi:glucose-6-phosphate dehydrogenase assembly protein OpcA